jgi:O-acetyl-ADP-ribose deacetylase (regulator of RNase III)
LVCKSTAQEAESGSNGNLGVAGMAVITTDGLDRVLAYLPVFERQPNELYEVNLEVSLLDPYSYAPKVNQFIHTLYQEGLVIQFDWTIWQEEAGEFINNPEQVQTAALETIQKLLTTHVRKERFCSGHLAHTIQTGHLLAILNRLAGIRSHMATEILTTDWQQRVEVVQGDITQQAVDAIVNAANESLLGGGGVDGAIHRAAGPQLLEECRKLGGCQTGQAKITQGYNLSAKWVIHTVGPVWQGGQQHEDELLAKCYQNSLALAVQHSVRTIAFPAISTGVYRFPLDRATQIAVTEVKTFLIQNSSVEQVRFVCFGEATYQCYLDVVTRLATQ